MIDHDRNSCFTRRENLDSAGCDAISRPEAFAFPSEIFAALARGGGGPAGMELLLAAQRSRNLLLLRAMADQEPDTYHALAEIEEAAPEVLPRLLRHPSVGARLLESADLRSVVASAAVLAGASGELTLPAEDGWVVLPALGRAAVRPGRTRVTVEIGASGALVDGRIRIPGDPHDDAPGWQGLRRVDLPGWSVVLDDVDPYRLLGHAGLADRLSDAEAAHWRGALSDAWRLLRHEHPGPADEVSRSVVTITPLNAPAGRRLGATAQDTFGTVFVSRPHDAPTLALSLTHEVQHLKLCGILDIVPLIGADDGTRVYAPWRPDPRPLAALLHGAYAFLGVAGFWRIRAAREGWEAQASFVHWLEAVRSALNTLETSGRLTAEGRRFVAGMRATTEPWSTEPVEARARARAEAELAEHRRHWSSARRP